MKITIKNVIMVLPGSVECSKDVREGFLLEELAEENRPQFSQVLGREILAYTCTEYLSI